MTACRFLSEKSADKITVFWKEISEDFSFLNKVQSSSLASEMLKWKTIPLACQRSRCFSVHILAYPSFIELVLLNHSKVYKVCS